VFGDIKTVKRDLVAMQKKGVLLREGNTSASRWVLLKENAWTDML
jgi:hypothetical protein